MEVATFGRTGLPISRVTLGAGAVGGIMLREDPALHRAVLDRVRAGGINWIDTAASYGNGVSETHLGRLLADVPEAERPTISTKFRIDPSDSASLDAQIRQSLEKSMTRLQMDFIPVFQLHNPVGPDLFPADQVLGTGGVFDTLDSLKDEGLIGDYGFTALGDPEACRQIVASGRPASAQVYYNLLNPSAGYPVPDGWTVGNFAGLLDLCRETDTAVMNIRIFAGGALASPKPHGREIPINPNTEVETELARAETLFAVLGDKYGTRAQTAVRFGLGDPRVTTVVIGLAELSELEEALGAVEPGGLPEEAIAAVAPLWNTQFGEIT